MIHFVYGNTKEITGKFLQNRKMNKEYIGSPFDSFLEENIAVEVKNETVKRLISYLTKAANILGKKLVLQLQ